MPNNTTLRLIIVSGLSGSGKSVALNTLEDEGFYCVDNLPLSLLPDFTQRMLNQHINIYQSIAVGIDARSGHRDLKNFESIISKVKEFPIQVDIVFLKAELDTLFKRFSETRRKHPLTRRGIPLFEAIEIENSLLAPIAHDADLTLDTTQSNIHQFRSVIKERLLDKKSETDLSILFQSFGFKHGSPTDSDFVFDVRCLPNPHWETNLRPLTGQDPGVIRFLQSYQVVDRMFQQIADFIESWIPEFEAQNRYYLTVSIGCTGGQHRSVYLAETLCNYFSDKRDNVSLRHRELE
ncbi:MAG: RNase adapter RapZ [Gammaproteobacteria bacterium]|nr:RNase adapter RapZ [Gammaproteobacteria bacterium]